MSGLAKSKMKIYRYSVLFLLLLFPFNRFLFFKDVIVFLIPVVLLLLSAFRGKIHLSRTKYKISFFCSICFCLSIYSILFSKPAGYPGMGIPALGLILFFITFPSYLCMFAIHLSKMNPRANH